MKQLKAFFSKYEWVLVLVLVFTFVAIRLPAKSQPLHQDEYKWTGVGDTITVPGLIPHPPLGELIYQAGGSIVGFSDNYRLVPLFFGMLNLILLYYLVRLMFGKREALIASLIWIFSYFSILASLMIDTDGAVMPFFFLLSLIGYYKFQNSKEKNKIWWGVFLLIALALGLLVKMSFILAIGAIVADFLWSKRKLITKKDLLKYFGYGIGAVILFSILLFVLRQIFPFFDLTAAVGYWEHFWNSSSFLNRGWFQTFIQCIKAILYSSPILVLVPIFGFFKGFKEHFVKLRVFIFFLIFAFIFYVVIFDFSIGALDRYLQLLVLPLTVMTTIVISIGLRKEADANKFRIKEFLLLSIIISLVLILLASIPHYVPSLHPKSEWLTRIFSFKWNFVYPFSGGSGPLGFYVSFLFMGLAWIASLVSLLIAFYKPSYRKFVLIFLIPLGIAYNGMFIEEYMVGYFNGHGPTLISHAVDFIKAHPEIKKVTVYNDNGAQEIKTTGTYRRRLYTDPAFIGKEKVDYLNTYKEYYFVLDVPRVDPTSIYEKYFNSCNPIYNEVDKKMSATIYDCHDAVEIKLP